MDFITLSNGVKMPQIGYGVFLIDNAQCERLVFEAIDVGYRHIDTAQAYYNEEGVGAAVAKCGVAREELFITTKIWVANAGYEKACASIDESLKSCKRHTSIYCSCISHLATTTALTARSSRLIKLVKPEPSA